MQMYFLAVLLWLYHTLVRGFSEFGPSAWALIGANVVPLFGVLFFGWDTFAVVALYWVENVIIGAINVLKIVTCDPDSAEIRKEVKENEELDPAAATALATQDSAKLFFAPFFALHYGFFCMIHGALVLAIFDEPDFGNSPLGVFHDLTHIATDRHLGWAVAGLAASHLYSYFRNYLGRGEYRRTTPGWLMFEPYSRIVVLHMAILLGGFVSLMFGNNFGLLALLIIGKTMLDLSMHLREREKNAANSDSKPEPIMPEKILHEAPRK
jgi:hypothetical protein